MSLWSSRVSRTRASQVPISSVAIDATVSWHREKRRRKLHQQHLQQQHRPQPPPPRPPHHPKRAASAAAALNRRSQAAPEFVREMLVFAPATDDASEASGGADKDSMAWWEIVAHMRESNEPRITRDEHLRVLEQRLSQQAHQLSVAMRQELRRRQQSAGAQHSRLVMQRAAEFQDLTRQLLSDEAKFYTVRRALAEVQSFCQNMEAENAQIRDDLEQLEKERAELVGAQQARLEELREQLSRVSMVSEDLVRDERAVGEKLDEAKRRHSELRRQLIEIEDDTRAIADQADEHAPTPPSSDDDLDAPLPVLLNPFDDLKEELRERIKVTQEEAKAVQERVTQERKASSAERRRVEEHLDDLRREVTTLDRRIRAKTHAIHGVRNEVGVLHELRRKIEERHEEAQRQKSALGSAAIVPKGSEHLSKEALTARIKRFTPLIGKLREIQRMLSMATECQVCDKRIDDPIIDPYTQATLCRACNLGASLSTKATEIIYNLPVRGFLTRLVLFETHLDRLFHLSAFLPALAEVLWSWDTHFDAKARDTLIRTGKWGSLERPSSSSSSSAPS